MGLANYFNELDIFVYQMKQKLIKVENKHKHDILNYNEIKYHLIDEILELFELRHTKNGEKIRRILNDSNIKIDECIDVSNLCFALDLTYKK